MKLIVILLSIIATQANSITENFDINGVIYRRQILYQNISGYLFHLDYHTNNLYFISNNKLRTFNFNTKKFKYIDTTGMVSTLTIDQETHDVYIGATDGIYKYNPLTDKVHLIGVNGLNVWNLFFKDVLYYTKVDESYISTLINGQSTKWIDLGHNVTRLFIVNEDIIYFSYYSELYQKKYGSSESVALFDKEFVNSLSGDRNGKVFFNTNSGIYEIINDDPPKVKQVAAIQDVRSMTFDYENNILYNDYNNILYQLKPVADAVNDTTIELSNNNTNNFSDRNKQALLDTITNNFQDIKNQLKTFNTKIDSLAQKIDKLQSDISKKQSSYNESTPKIYLDFKSFIKPLLLNNADDKQSIQNP